MESEYRLKWELLGGSAPLHWSFTSLEALLDNPKAIAVGVMYPGENTKNGIPLIKVSDVKNGKVIAKPDFLISEEKDYEYRRTKILGNELLITLVGNPGDCVLVTEDMIGWNVARAIAALRLKNIDLRSWVRYICLSHPAQHFFDSRLNTTVQKTLNLKDIKELVLPIPPKDERENITNFIDALDNKIELNHQMNATLEAIAQALFKSWFVDFDPVIDNAIAAGNPIPEPFQARAAARQALGDKRKPLPPDIQQQFGDRFIFNDDLGWIPDRWGAKPVYEIAKFVNGAAFKEKYFSSNKMGLPIIKIAEIKNGITGQTRFTEEVLDTKYYINNGEILFSWSGNPDTSINTFIWSNGLGWLNQHIFKVCLFTDLEREFVYYLLKYLKPVFTEIARDKQTTGLGHVTAGDMKKLLVIDPPKEILDLFSQQSASIYDRWYMNLEANKQLAQTRDTLLPKLLSGQIRIPDAEALAAEAM